MAVRKKRVEKLPARKPFTVQIMGTVIQVQWARELKAPDGDRVHGYYDPSKDEIWLDADSSTTLVKEILIHECYHAACTKLGFSQPETRVQAISAALGQMLAGVMKSI